MNNLQFLLFALVFLGVPVIVAWLKLEGRRLQLAALAWLVGSVMLPLLFQLKG